MQHILLLFLVLFSLTACQDKEQAKKEQALHDAQIVAQARAELSKEFAIKEATLKKSLEQNEIKIAQQARDYLLLEQKSEEKKLQYKQSQQELSIDKLAPMGVNVKEGVILIDTNKTKDFFKNISKIMGDKIQKVSQDMKKGMIDIQNAGIAINDEHIHIDLNKTRSLLDTWSQNMQIFVQEFDSLTHKIEHNITK